jgi:hypothetical protein
LADVPDRFAQDGINLSDIRGVGFSGDYLNLLSSSIVSTSGRPGYGTHPENLRTMITFLDFLKQLSRNYSTFIKLRADVQTEFLGKFRAALSDDQMELLRSAPRKTDFIKRLVDFEQATNAYSAAMTAPDEAALVGKTVWDEIGGPAVVQSVKDGTVILQNPIGHTSTTTEQWVREHLSDRAALANVIEPGIKGGIDLSQQESALQVTKDANGGVKVSVDPALVARIEREGMSEIDPVIINMQPADIRSLFGPQAGHSLALGAEASV